VDDIAFDVQDDGTLRMVYHPNDERARAVIKLLGEVLNDVRAGYVWPENRALRAVFRLLRWVFGGKGRVAAWTRAWRGRWIVVDARTKRRIGGAYPTHDLAVEGEVRWSLASSAWF
jgi:hypothetical protein